MRIKGNDKKECIPQYANRLRTMAMNIPDTTSDDMPTDFFMQGLTPSLRSTALTIQGSFDKVVSGTSLIASEGGIDHESVRPVEETENLDRLVAEIQERLKKNPASGTPPRPPGPSTSTPRHGNPFANGTCFHCKS